MSGLLITGMVEPGEGFARTLGCPTANLAPEQGLVIPGTGIYLANSYYEDGIYPSIVCVGAGRNDNNFKIEVHFLDETIDLQGKSLTIKIIKKLRDLIPWPGEDKMRDMIHEDMENAREWFSEHPEALEDSSN